MKVDLSEREIQLIVHLLTKQVNKVDDGESKLNFSIDELVLLEKLEQTLKIERVDIKDLNSKYYN